MNTLIKSHLLKRSPRKVALFTFITFEFYSIYWFYKMFKTTGDRFPILKTIFSFIFVFQLFSNIYKSVGLQKSPWALIYASIYFITTVASTILAIIFMGTDLYFLFVLASASILSVVIGKVHQVTQKNTQEGKYLGGELVWLTLGLIGSVLSLVSFIFFAPTNVVNERHAEINTRLQVAEKKQDDLYLENQKCNDRRDAEFQSLDNSNQATIDAYNKTIETCNDLYEQYMEAASEYMKINFEYFPAMLRNQ